MNRLNAALFSDLRLRTSYSEHEHEQEQDRCIRASSLLRHSCFVIPLSCIVVSEPPKTATGKVQKYVLQVRDFESSDRPNDVAILTIQRFSPPQMLDVWKRSRSSSENVKSED